MTVTELGVRMSGREFADWRAYEKVTGPFGAERHDVLASMTAYYIVSALGAKKARLDKMLPVWDRRPQDWRQQREFFKALTVAAGGEVR